MTRQPLGFVTRSNRIDQVGRLLHLFVHCLRHRLQKPLESYRRRLRANQPHYETTRLVSRFDLWNQNQNAHLDKQRVGQKWQLPERSSTQTFAPSGKEKGKTKTSVPSWPMSLALGYSHGALLTQRCPAGSDCARTPRSWQSPSSPAQTWWRAAAGGRWSDTAHVREGNLSTRPIMFAVFLVLANEIA